MPKSFFDVFEHIILQFGMDFRVYGFGKPYKSRKLSEYNSHTGFRDFF